MFLKFEDSSMLIAGPQESGETRCAFLGESSVFIGDGAADCGRVVAFAVFETAADTEFTMAVFTADCAKLAGIFTFSGVMAGDNAFIIVGGFQFEQMAAAPAAIRQVGVAQHHALTAGRLDLFQKIKGVGIVSGRCLFDDADRGLRVAIQPALQHGQALIKIALCLRYIENV